MRCGDLDKIISKSGHHADRKELCKYRGTMNI